MGILLLMMNYYVIHLEVLLKQTFLVCSRTIFLISDVKQN